MVVIQEARIEVPRNESRAIFSARLAPAHRAFYSAGLTGMNVLAFTYPPRNTTAGRTVAAEVRLAGKAQQ